MPRPHVNRVENSVIGGDSIQIGHVHGDVTFAAGREIPPRHVVVPVREADPLRLGVHRPITVGSDTSMPHYVPRDVDVRLRALIAEAAERGGFVLLVGGSSVGKTRSLFEAVRQVVPDRSLVQPTTVRGLEGLDRIVLWLDELQSHLDGEHGLSASVVRGLLARQVIVVATLWPDYYNAYTEQGEPFKDRYAPERDLLKLTKVVHVGAAFTTAERSRAEAAAPQDERLRVALKSRDFGLTQVLAAAPQLVHRWESAHPYARAVMTAALDATRLGAHSALATDFLEAAASGYCTPAERASAPADWFRRALDYATKRQLGATAPLVAMGQAMGVVDGYRVADYLLQHADRTRRATAPPQAFWDACASLVVDDGDAARLGRAALERRLHGFAHTLLDRAARPGLPAAMHDLVELHRTTGDRGQAADVIERLDASDQPDAALYRMLVDAWDFDEVARLAAEGNEYAVGHLIEYGDPEYAIELLLETFEPEKPWCWRKLADLYEAVGETDKAIATHEVLLARGDDEEIGALAELLKQADRLDRLRELTDEGYFDAACAFAEALEEKGDVGGALEVLHRFAGLGNREIDWVLADLLARRGHLDALVALAEEGVGGAADEAAKLLVSRGMRTEAVALAKRLGEADHPVDVAILSGDPADVEAVRVLADGHDERASRFMAEQALRQGDLDTATRYAEATDTTSDKIAKALVEDGQVDRALEFLRSKVDDDGGLSSLLNTLLRDHGRDRELRARISTGDKWAWLPLHELLVEQGRTVEAQRLREFGLTPDGEIATG
ncbi:hypothetical protein AB0K14_00320 [Actinosynnema sp. NPDC050801]|uniref:tetratricopeptide repeat protein n=1 Tax=unclassified Actinosynnema TaxID=2637065 RepID=UPI0033E9781B